MLNEALVLNLAFIDLRTYRKQGQRCGRTSKTVWKIQKQKKGEQDPAIFADFRGAS